MSEHTPAGTSAATAGASQDGIAAQADVEREALLDRLSRELEDAERDGQRIALLSERHPDLSEAEAYRIASGKFVRQQRQRAGYKLGYTSRAMREQMGIAEPNFGLLSRDMLLGPAAVIELAAPQLVHPRVEPEITLELGTDLRGPGCTREQAAAAIAFVYPSLEVVDTRYREYRFTLRDNIADNSSSAYCVLGEPLAYRDSLDLKGCAVELLGEMGVLASGQGADALGDPVLALAWLVDALARRGEGLKAGDRVMTGGLTRAFSIAAGETMRATFSALGELRLRRR